MRTAMPNTESRDRLFIDHDIDVRTYDIDYNDHVSNIRYFYWLEEMRNVLFEKYFPLEEFINQGLSPIIASTHIEYKRAIKLFDKPKARMWISEIGSASLTIECEITVAGQLTTTARHVGVFVEFSTGKPVRLPAVCKQKFHEAIPAVR
jgi:YbgC/YbaW family acyl-CoA thioester hydrolase